MEYKEKLYDALKHKRVYDDNLYKTYGFLWEHCARSMQNKISSRNNFESEIYNDTIDLLKVIKEHTMHYQEARYKMAIVSDELRSFVNLKQLDNESLRYYTKRFRTVKEVFESHIGGPFKITKYVEKMNGYDSSDSDVVEKLEKKASDHFFAFVYL